MSSSSPIDPDAALLNTQAHAQAHTHMHTQEHTHEPTHVPWPAAAPDAPLRRARASSEFPDLSDIAGLPEPMSDERFGEDRDRGEGALDETGAADDLFETRPVVEPVPDVNTTQILEQKVPLSRSMLWKLLEDYYDKSGIAAWDTVPFYPTSNAFIGDTYAALLIAFLMDVKSRLDPSAPVYVLELATGTGSFSFFMLTALLRKLEDLPGLQHLRLKYVMTDFTESNLNAWSLRSELQPFVASGLLDFALFRPEDQEQFQLKHSGEWVTSAELVNPLVVIANYFFDSLRQDLFRAEGDSLKEGLVTFYRYLKSSATASPITFDQLRVREDYQPCAEPYYDDPLFEQILRSYVGEAEVVSLIYPLGTLRCLRNLQRLSRGRMALISSDKGFMHPAFMYGLKKHPFTVHGSISYMVNYDAIRRFFEYQGGDAFYTPDGSLVLVSGMFLLFDEPMTWDMVRYTFQDQLVHSNRIHDLYCMHALLREINDCEEVLRGCLGLMRQSAWDPLVFESCAPRLYEQIRELDNRQKVHLLSALPHVRANVYPLRGSHYRALYWVGKLYYGLAQYEQAIDVLQEALVRVSGDEPNTLYYLGACYEMMDDERTALEYYLRARAYDPECVTTYGAIMRVMARLEAQEEQRSAEALGAVSRLELFEDGNA